MGRSWSSPAGGNLYVSFVLRPRRPADRLHGLTLAAAVAFTEALEELGAAVAIKWPNDLLLGGKKLGGILTELHVGRPKTFVVVGLGLNLASAPELPDGALVAASLAQLPGGPPDREALTAALRERLLAVVERFDEGGFAAVRPDWERRWRHKGRSVRADLPGGRSVEGIAIALDDDGALLLDTGGATPVRVTVGDVNACC